MTTLNIFDIITEESIKEINNTANEIMELIKAKKFFLVSRIGCNKDQRIKASNDLFIIMDAFEKAENRYQTVGAENTADLDALKILIDKIVNLLKNVRSLTTYKIKDYSMDIKPKLCRALISKIEYAFIIGEIDNSTIKDIYATLNKDVPKKFAKEELNETGSLIFKEVKKAIADKADSIKAASIVHYTKMVELIEDGQEITSPSEFIIAGRKKISDMNTLRLCLFAKFKNEDFRDLIDQDFESLVSFASYKISEKSIESDTPNVDVLDIHVGGKGFDIIIDVNNKRLNARAIPVQGVFVRFHYRYIITSI